MDTTNNQPRDYIAEAAERIVADRVRRTITTLGGGRLVLLPYKWPQNTVLFRRFDTN
jgi:hypothetical protein